jgi:uncharacterized protein
MTVIVETNVEARMRDGVVLRGDLYRPADGKRYPALVQRTPYNKEFLPLTGLMLDPIRAAARGYCVLIQDVRARFASDGDAFFMYRDERRDGEDSVRWAAAQDWCDGRVGTYGLSYMGATAWLAAAAAPDIVRAVVPATAPYDFWIDHLWRGGALQSGLVLQWALQVIGPAALLREKAGKPELMPMLHQLIDAVDDFDTWVRHRPFDGVPPARPDDNAFLPFFRDVVRRKTPDAFTAALLMDGQHENVNAPALIIAGWNDLFLSSDLKHFARMREQAATPHARDKTRIVIGPWSHGMFLPVVGERDHGVRAGGAFLDLKEDLTSLHLRWFDRWLKDQRNGVDDEAPVKIFVQGRNRWRDEPAWPLARANATSLYLRASGALSFAPPGDEAPDSFIYDPENPCPTLGGAHLLPMKFPRGSIDQAPILGRPDVLFYVTPPLDQDIEITGPITCRLYASTTGRDTDWIVKLCEVRTDGRALSITDGVVRARFRKSYDRPELLESGGAELYEIEFAPTSILLSAKARLAVLITSSDFPRYDRNPNTGDWPFESTRSEAARQHVFHDAARPSQLIVPMVGT